MENNFTNSVYKKFSNSLDPYTKAHSDRVSEYAILLGQKLGLPNCDLEKLKLGGLLHDIGKTEIPDSILQKNAKLTEDEYEEIKKHTIFGANLLSNAIDYKEIVPIVKYHHEKYDGTGYPNHLSGTNIPYLARIISIADCFDAMISKRVYKSPLPIETVINEFKKNKGIQFDPELTNAFLDILENNYDKIEQIQNKYD